MTRAHNIIMIVEDEPVLLQAITKKLTTVGVVPIACVGGHEALEYLEKNPQELPDAIWLDYYLKDMNGLEFMEKIKAKPEFSNIPVLVVSNSATEDKVTHMLALGASNYILKAEHRLEEIVGMIQEIATSVQKAA